MLVFTVNNTAFVSSLSSSSSCARGNIKEGKVSINVCMELENVNKVTLIALFMWGTLLRRNSNKFQHIWLFFTFNLHFSRFSRIFHHHIIKENSPFYFINSTKCSKFNISVDSQRTIWRGSSSQILRDHHSHFLSK